MWEILLPIFGFLIGTAASMTGIGGGAFIVPLLTLFYLFEPANAVGTSLTTIIFTALAATLNYSRQKRIYYRTGVVLAAATVPGALLGAYLTTIIPAKQLGLVFGFFLIFIAVRVLLSRDSAKGKSTNCEEHVQKSTSECDKEMFSNLKILLGGAALSFFGGVASGLLGVGGGVLIVPIMNLALGISMHIATATSMFTMIFTSMSGVTQHYLSDHISFEYAIPIAIGTIIGAQAGAYTSKKISGKNLGRIFGIMLIVVSIQMILKYM